MTPRGQAAMCPATLACSNIWPGEQTWRRADVCLDEGSRAENGIQVCPPATFPSLTPQRCWCCAGEATPPRCEDTPLQQEIGQRPEQSPLGSGQESVCCCCCLLFRSAGVLSERTCSPGAPVYLLPTCHLAAPLMDPSARPTPSRCSDEGHAASAAAPLIGWRLAPQRRPDSNADLINGAAVDRR